MRRRCGERAGRWDELLRDRGSRQPADLARSGVAPDQHVTIMIEPDDWLTEVRRFARPRVIAKGWRDADIDRIIEEERDAVQPSVG